MTDILMISNGWIYNLGGNGEQSVVARGLTVWNPGDLDELSEDTPVEVTEKIDGRLGILYPDASQRSGYALASKDSLFDPISKHGTELLQNHLQNWHPRTGFTYLFEIVSELTKGFVNYGGDDDVYLVAILNTTTGDVISVRHPHVAIPRTPIHKFSFFGEFICGWKPAKNTEGVVVRNLLTGDLIKYQTEEFLEWRKNDN